MATVLPPPSKKAKIAAAHAEDLSSLPHVLVQFQDATTNESTSTVTIPGAVTNKQLELLLNKLLGQDDPLPYFFALTTENGSVDITTDLYTDVLKTKLKSAEEVLTLIYTPQAVFRVKPVSRCSSAIKGHSGVILAAQFSPASSRRMVTGSGDFTARVWDCDTQTPLHTLRGHSNWVLCVSYSPDGTLIATGSMDNTLRLWDANAGTALGDAMKSHTKWITSMVWEPLHLASGQSRLASSSKDATVRIWDTSLRRVIIALSGHSAAVTCVRWGGNGWIYSASQDKTIKIWEEDGRLLHTLSAHSHWVNHMALSTDFVLRTGAFDHTGEAPLNREAAKTKARKRYEQAISLFAGGTEHLITGSDDSTLYLWDPTKSTRPLARLNGHQKPVNHVTFSPDGRYIASASFDNHVKLWNARDGKFIASLRGHVAPVYQCAWSADSRLLVSSSKDTTIKVWDIRTKRLHTDLPGHEDEVFAVDWSPDGLCVASGGKDRAVRLWRH